MNSLILQTVTRFLSGVLLVFSAFLLLRGHNLPGGGFGGGLVFGGAFALQAISCGVRSARALLGIDPRTLAGLGLIVALGSGLLRMGEGAAFLTGLWGERVFPVVGKLGTPLLFDVGVYLLVSGVCCLVVFSLFELGEED